MDHNQTHILGTLAVNMLWSLEIVRFGMSGNEFRLDHFDGSSQAT